MEKQFVAYEYKEVVVSKARAEMVSDLVENFGWEITSKVAGIGKVTYSLKRAYNISNKEKVSALEKEFFDNLAQLEKVNSTKFDKGGTVALTVGLVGIAFVAGATFSYLGGLIALMVGLAVPGFAMWGLAPYLNKKINQKNSEIADRESAILLDKIYKIALDSFNLIKA